MDVTTLQDPQVLTNCEKLINTFHTVEPLLRKISKLFFLPAKFKNAMNEILDKLDEFILAIQTKEAKAV